ncbi:UDP-2,4-diacetamido-2,4,6-trideoxy-beta-L-altropyranose hydrolase [Aliifodinibius sp. S!AR15-10]|uniref:UDP-2,4-diacetamido-2,4, 6-trideoxy-beta-L-altropyranose hydrolase n=1 Tax=Aliifodinibius sp. S!AR15-10 TaxID=2950437 RepID=UPI0028593A60|nr:UDP-2,4-diacetamido-2,4,6-trideoxy-beta-L-altropyranose hydrolase [Aliifodinibius sp. S!AR15-10]MDR8393495.1 UDP-2,4-diacetamido-2,4,6-trideoxy-beta-L-altropyranose hydrolase [Aliifodinibius sp. S!AR15-10]
MDIPESVFFRVDASNDVGMGHARRCLVIAKEVMEQYQGKVIFLSNQLPASFEKEILSLGIEVIYKDYPGQSEVEFISNATVEKEINVIVIDSYDNIFYKPGFQKAIINDFNRLAYITFDSEPHYYAHVLHNQNPLSHVQHYRTESYTKCLFGLQNLILDRKFRDVATSIQPVDENKDLRTCLLTFGGSDPNNLTVKVLEAIESMNFQFETCKVVIGAMYNHTESLKRFINSSTLHIKLFQDVDNMQELMCSCDVAFVSGGTTNWELGALNKPFIVFPAGKREYQSANFLNQRGLAQLVEDPLSLNTEQLGTRINQLLKNDIRSMAASLKKKINIDGVTNLVRELLSSL